MQLPSGNEQRSQLVQMIKAAEQTHNKIDLHKDTLKELRQDVKEKFDISPKDFNNLVKAWMDSAYPHEMQAEGEELEANIGLLRS